jgi:hypothetical protein
MQDYLPGVFAAGCSTWPPNLKRIADKSISPKLWSLPGTKALEKRCRENIGGHRLLNRRIDVQRPSPESSTSPEKFASAESSASAMAVRSSSQDEMTLPRRHTSANIGEIQGESLALAQARIGLAGQNAETFDPACSCRACARWCQYPAPAP